VREYAWRLGTTICTSVPCPTELVQENLAPILAARSPIPAQTPMTVCAVRLYRLHIEPASIIAATHSEFVLPIIEIHYDSRSIGVTECIRDDLLVSWLIRRAIDEYLKRKQ